MISFLAVLIVFSVLILVHETGHFLMAKRMGVRVERFAFGFGPKIFSFKKGDTEYLLCAIPLGGYVKMAGDEPDGERQGKDDEFLSKSPIRRFGIVVSGPLTNYIMAFLLFSLIFFLGAPVMTSQIGKVLEDSPASKAGILADDEIVAVDGVAINNWEELLPEISKATDGREIELSVLRDGKEVALEVRPEVIEAKNIFGQEIRVGRIGIASSGATTTVKSGPIDSLVLGAKKTLFLTGFTYKALWHMITGGISFKESAAGPIGIASMIGQAAKMGFIYLLNITAHINLAIAIFNLLPFPVLDGGHILFLLIEKIRGRQITPKVEQVITNVGMTLLICLAVFVTWNDIVRMITK